MINQWLNLLCRMLPGVNRAAVVRRGGGGCMAHWPESAPLDDLLGFSGEAELKGTPCYRPSERNPELTLLVRPLKNRGLLVGTLCLELPLKPEQRSTTQLLIDWSQGWLDLLSQTNRARADGYEKLLTLLEQSGRFERLADTATAVATATTEAFLLTQAVICVRRRDRLSVAGVSHAPGFEPGGDWFSTLVANLERMEQDQTDLDETDYPRFLAEQSRPLGAACFKLTFAGNAFGYLLVYFPTGQALSEPHRLQLTQLCQLLSPLLHSLREQEEGALWRFRARVLARLRGNSLRTRLGWTVAATVLALLVCLVPGRQVVKANAHLEGKVQRAIVAPEEGFLKEANATAGELIKKGQVLAQLDDQPIALEVARWQGEVREYERQFNRELNALDHVQMRIAKARLAQAEAQLNLYRDRQQRVRITAPIDGVIIKGDLSRAVGSPVSRGQVLYEIAPLDEFKLVIQVDEADIRFLQSGQGGNLVLSAFPHRKIPFKVASVASLHSESEDRLSYRVEAALDAEDLAVRPGMGGIAKIEVGHRPFGWLLLRRPVEWLVLKLWAL